MFQIIKKFLIIHKHFFSGNYLEQGVERIVDQVVNPKVASVFIPQVEDLVYNYLGIPRKKTSGPETGEKKPDDLLPTDLEAVSPGSVKSNDDKNEAMDTNYMEKMDVEPDQEVKEEKAILGSEKKENTDIEMSEVTVKSNDSESMDKSSIPLPTGEINLENIPAPANSPPKATKVELEDIALPHEPDISTDIPLPDGAPKIEKDTFFKPIQLHSEESSSSSDSSLIRNMSPLTPIRNFNNENSCDAQQGFEDDSDCKSDEKAAPSSFRFTIETKDAKDNSNSNLDIKRETDSKKTEQIDLSYQFTNQVNINTYNTPVYDDSSNSNNLHIDYESDVNSKNIEMKLEIENSQDSKKDKKSDDRKSHKNSHRSRDSSRHSTSKGKRSDSKHSTSRDSSRHDKKSSKDDKSKSSKERDKSKDRSERKDRGSSKHHDSSRSSHKSSKDKDSKSHRSSSSSHRHSSKSSDERKSSSSSKEKDKIPDSFKDKSRDKPKDSKSSINKADKDRKSSSSKKPDDKDKKKEKKDIDDHYSSSGRGNHSRRSTDRDSNDGSSSSKGSQNHNGSKSAENKKDSKPSSSKSDNTSTSGESPSPSDKEHIIKDNSKLSNCKPVVRVDNHLETPIATPPRLPFVPDVTLKKPKFAANLQEAKKLMKMRKFLDEEQKRMNQEAALLLEFQANVRPSLSQVYSSIPGPELEFACLSNAPVGSVAYEIANVQTNENTEEKDTCTDIKVEKSETVNISQGIQSPIKKDDNAIEPKEIKENVENKELIQETIKTDNLESPQEPDDKNENTYDENKPFSELMNEITEYSKASETKAKTDGDESKMEDFEDNIKTTVIQTECIEAVDTTNTLENKYFEVTIITEELSESETGFELNDEVKEGKNELENIVPTESNPAKDSNATSKEINAVSIEQNTNFSKKETVSTEISNELQYFAEHEKYNAELERQEFSNFFVKFVETVNARKKIYLVNCDTYEENIMKDVVSSMGDFEVVNYYKNGHLKVPNTTTNIVKDVPLSTEITLPVESKSYIEKSPLFSPVKSECSFELHSDYDTKLDDINKKSRQEVMEIILGSIIDSSPSKMPKIDYFTESTIESEMDNLDTEVKSETDTLVSTVESETESLKRSIDEVESSVNNNRPVLTPKKIRKLSNSDQISSTTEGEC